MKLLREFEFDATTLAPVRGSAEHRINSLSEREREALLAALSGKSNKQIAYELGVAHFTVRTWFRRAGAKLQATGRPELLRIVLKEQSRTLERRVTQRQLR